MDKVHIREQFKNHMASFTDYGNIKIVDFRRPDTSNFRIRFLFEEDYCRLHISGDLGELTAVNYNNMTFEGFSDFIGNIEYFKQKIVCHSRPLYEWDEEKAAQDIRERLEEYEYEPEDEYETVDDKIADILVDFDSRSGIGSRGQDVLSEIDPDCWEIIERIGRKDTGILDLYLVAFELATEQLLEKRYGENVLLDEFSNELSCRTLNAVKRAGIVTTLDLTYITSNNLKKCNQIGVGALKELESFCQRHGITIGSNAENLPSLEPGTKVYSISDKTKLMEIKDKAISFRPNPLPLIICTYKVKPSNNDEKNYVIKECRCSLGELIRA